MTRSSSHDGVGADHERAEMEWVMQPVATGEAPQVGLVSGVVRSREAMVDGVEGKWERASGMR